MTYDQPPLADGAGGSAVPRRVLVTGGAGFIGSHVVEALLRHGVPVTVLDDLSTGVRANLPEDSRLRFVYGDVTDREAIECALMGCERVVHLAAIASVQRSIEDAAGTHRVNFEATQTLLEVAHRVGVERVVYASSAAVYGDAQTPPVEEVGELGPQTPYAVDKLRGEQVLEASRREHGMQGVALRFFNVYGPRQRADSPYSGVISLFVRGALEGAPITVFGDGEQTRDFVYVGDVARVVTALTLRPDPPVEAVMNVGRGEAVSVLQLIETIERVLGVRMKWRDAAARVGEVRHSRADVGRLRRELGWAPPTALEAGLRRYVEEVSKDARACAPCTDAPRPSASGN